MNKKNVNLFNASTILFHLAVLGIGLFKPFNEILSLIAAFAISIFLIVFGLYVEKKSKNKISGKVYHFVGCYSFLLCYWFLAKSSIIAPFNLSFPTKLCGFFFILSCLCALTSIKYDDDRYIYISYSCVVFMLLSFLGLYKITTSITYILLLLTISVIDIIYNFISKNKNNIVNIILTIVSIILLYLLMEGSIKDILLACSIITFSSLLKLVMLNDNTEKICILFKIPVMIFSVSRIFPFEIIPFICSEILILMVYYIGYKSKKLDKDQLSLLYIFILIIPFISWRTQNREVFCAAYSCMNLIGMLINRNEENNRILSVFLSTIFAYFFFDGIIREAYLKNILGSVVIMILSIFGANRYIKEDKNKDLFISIVLLINMMNILRGDLRIYESFVILISAVAIYYSMISKYNCYLKKSGAFLMILSIIKLVDRYIKIDLSIYLLIFGLFLSIGLFRKINNQPNIRYCSNCGAQMKNKDCCEKCGKK